MKTAILRLAPLAIITLAFLLGTRLAGGVPADPEWDGSSSATCCTHLDLASKEAEVTGTTQSRQFSMSAVVGVDVLGLIGRRVKRLMAPTLMTPKSYRTIWDGLDAPNNLLARGPQNLLRRGHDAIARSIMRE